jgi:hypothetical protein
MLKVLLIPVVVLAVLFAPAAIVAVNIVALAGFVVYSLASGIKESFSHFHHAGDQAA